MVADSCTPEPAAPVVAAAAGHHPLVNNAGVLIRKKSIEFNDEDISTLLGTNFVSGFHISQLSHPLFKASGNGSIVFISSIAGAMAISDCAIYGATKGTHVQINIY
ncbi:hypothetical protein F8388_024964 [Cannabis sativa]|uniref:Uncharacterized protein n=1 Tax=Cannabis sativa TaxID=3483 RepID=A0A7J6G393_CANSA|nr:hypothetical protein F8388_024964 [Cannabis sativa]